MICPWAAGSTGILEMSGFLLQIISACHANACKAALWYALGPSCQLHKLQLFKNCLRHALQLQGSGNAWLGISKKVHQSFHTIRRYKTFWDFVPISKLQGSVTRQTRARSPPKISCSDARSVDSHRIAFQRVCGGFGQSELQRVLNI